MKSLLLKNLLLAFIAVSISELSIAQNLVNNPGFEINIGNPNNSNELSLATGWSNCNGTYGPTNYYGTPDYYTTSGSGFAQLPNTGSGTIAADSGNAIMGLVLYDGEGVNYREYARTFLTSPLTIGQTYTVSLYAANAASNPVGQYTSNNLGILFSVDSTIQQTSQIINRTPQVNSTGVVAPNGWTNYSFTFTADSAYRYITIGNFYDDNSTTLVLSYPSGSAPYAYYYFDNISVTPSSVCVNPNLVNNPGFEINIGNPNNSNELSLATGWSNCNGTYGPTNNYGTPDYYTISGSGFAQLPNTGSGTVTAESGNAIMGLVLYDGEGVNYREYARTFLTSPLTIGQTYTVSLYAANAASNPVGQYTSNNLGILFSVDSTIQQTSQIINRTPQVNSTGVVAPNGWTNYSFTLTADSAYRYITIGNFYDDNSTTLVLSYPSGSAPYAYYYFDNISVSQQCTEGINTLTTTNLPISVYPNPASDYVIFSLDNLPYTNKPVTLILYNSLGQKVNVINNIESTHYTLYKNTLSTGLYFYQFYNTDGVIASGKIIFN